jgi:hypothetical protein
MVRDFYNHKSIFFDLFLKKVVNLRIKSKIIGSTKTPRLTKSFTNLYGETKFTVINRDNFYEEIDQFGLDSKS